MESSKLAVKFFADIAADLPHDAFVRVFHQWIRDRAVPGHLLIDVADYGHVDNGPGTLLVALEAHLHIDYAEGRPGLLYARKRAMGGSFRDRLLAAIGTTLVAAARLEREPSLAGKVKFKSDEVSIRIMDRLHAPNTAATFDAVKSDIEAVLRELYGSAKVSLEHRAGEQTPFEVRAKVGGAPDVATLAQRADAGASTAVR